MIHTPLTLRPGLELANRLVLAPMTTYSSYPDGRIREDELPYLQRRAAGGFGLVMTAACAVHPRGKAFNGQWACWDDSYLESLRSVAHAIHQGGAKAVLQIHHGGRQCPSAICGGDPLSASAIPAERPNAETPRAMTEEEIQDAIRAYAESAERARRAGFDGVEIHGANTYLIQQFVSPHSNRRNDAWGQDRLAFAREVTDAVLRAVPEFPVGYRFSPEERETPGIRIDHTLALVEMLSQRELAWLHISLGDFRQGSIVGDFEDSILVRIHRQIAGRIPLIGVGSIKTHDDAEACLDLGCELVAIGKAALTEPEWPRVESPRLEMPADGMAEAVTLPKGLEEKILATPGWIPVASV